MGQRSTKSWADTIEYTEKGKREALVYSPKPLCDPLAIENEPQACLPCRYTSDLTASVPLPASPRVFGFVLCFFKVAPGPSHRVRSPVLFIFYLLFY